MNNNENQQQHTTAEASTQNTFDSLFGDKDQLIAHFQDLTSIEDIGQCFELLETANWNLNDAVQTYFTQNELMQQQTSEEPEIINFTNDAAISINTASNIIENNDLINNPVNLQAIGTSLQDLAYTNYNYPRRYLDFEIEYKTKKEMFHIPDTETIGTLKKLCEKEFNIPYEKQILKGWKDRDPTLINTDVDSVTLRDLQLPLKTTLFLLKKKSSTNTSPSTSSKSNTSPSKHEIKIESCIYDILINVNLNIPTTSANSDVSNNLKPIHLKYDSDKKFIKLKQDMTKLTTLNVNNQDWFWKYPEIIEEEKDVEIIDGDIISSDKFVKISKDFDNLHLYELKNYLYNLYSAKITNNVNLFKLEFYLKENRQEKRKSKIEEDIEEIQASNNNDEDNYTQDIDDDNVDLDDDDDDDDMQFCFSDTNITNNSKRKTLISDDYNTEAEAIEQFVTGFSTRYGSLIPHFHIDSLENAMQNSLLQPVSTRKLLAIYLHSDNTLYSNIFCSKILCDEEIINYLSVNLVLWPWDLTLTKNEAYFYNLCSKHFGGSTVINTIKQSKDKLPAILLLTRVRSNNEIIAVIEGDASKEHLMLQLINADDMFQQQRSKDSIEEKQREEREKIKREQDAAYQASLDYDKAKRQKQEEEKSKEIEVMRQNEQNKIKFEKEFNEKKLFCINHLKEEPKLTNDNSKLLTTIRIKEPNGKMLTRRFNSNDPLEQVLYYLGSLGYFGNKYKLLTTWPRRDLALEVKEKSLQDLKLYPQETIILEEKDE